MADSTTPITQITVGQTAKESYANALFDAASPGMLYGRNSFTSSLLVFGYYGGRYQSTTIANGTVTCGTSTSTYVVANKSTGAVSSSTATTNWNDSSNYERLYKLITDATTITSYEDHRQLIGSTLGGSFTGGTLTSALNEAPIVTIASAATVAIGAAAGNTISISGTTTITAFDSIADGARRLLYFQGALTLTHNATSLILPTATNITTAAGDTAEALSLGSGNWRITSYQRKDGSPLAGSASRSPIIQSVTSAATVTPTFADDVVLITAQAAGLTLANPTGTAIDALGIVIRIKDNGTARSITFGSQYRALGITLPTTTVVSKTLYLAMIFNNTDTKWDVLAVGQEA